MPSLENKIIPGQENFTPYEIEARNVYKPLAAKTMAENFAADIFGREILEYSLITSPGSETFDSNIFCREILEFSLIASPGSETFDSHIFGRSILFKLLTEEAKENFAFGTILPNYELLKKCVLKEIDLAPGETLVIDADEYIVLKDGVEAMQIHSGDWIDEIDRDTDAIGIVNTTGSVPFSASLIFVERYL